VYAISNQRVFIKIELYGTGRRRLTRAREKMILEDCKQPKSYFVLIESVEYYEVHEIGTLADMSYLRSKNRHKGIPETAKISEAAEFTADERFVFVCLISLTVIKITALQDNLSS